ncbi:ANTHOCYANIN 5-AROMATIC ACYLTRANSFERASE [Salix purpurea]|uniref:ANTHOCYANIN 5-AROMATIC ACYLTRANSFERASE n=1 Tax=Salix purpurea TaxID=77065 RepID=A0A9Q0UBE3_SALPP|nr:ANTHOCYANIN 5-AROMATIC ACYLTRANSFERASE [Salix purpurea]
MSSATSLTVVSQCNVFPDKKSTLEDLKLSVCDLPMLSCHYIQKGGLFARHPALPVDSLISHLKQSLSQTLSHFPPLAGRFSTDSNGYIYITCNDAGVDFIHATANNISTQDILCPLHVPDCVRGFFAFESTVSYQGHYKPILAVQVTELADGVFIGCSVNHSVADGTSFWNFFNTFSEVSRGIEKISRQPDFSRNSILISEAVLKVPQGGPQVTFNENEPICERIFSFSREAILKLKSKVNDKKWSQKSDNTDVDAVELMGKQSNDTLLQIHSKGKVTAILESWFKNAVLKPQQMESNLSMGEISSFQSLCALLWRAVTRARKLNPSKTTTFRMAVNCRHRLSPKLDTLYFGNAIQSVPTHASAGDVLSRDLHWCAEQLNKTVVAHNDEMVRRFIEDWESNPRCFPLGNLDGASMTMGSSPRFPMYDNDFGWGRPLAVRSGKANKFDGKMSAFPGREGNGTVDLEVVLAPEAMAGIESDHEFMQFVSL